MKLTIGIKALNEERRIEAAIVSALAAAAPWGGEVILADSGSTDQTVQIAKRFPVRIVQLSNPADRCCGAGAQLAFQYARGDYFYLMDGDMVSVPGFIDRAINFLDANPEVAGVGGAVREMNLQSYEFQVRAASIKHETHRASGYVDRLDGGGMYRTQAICDVEYFADRNLLAFEEFELGARLRKKGWKLARIDMPAVDHFGHELPGYELLWKRVKSGYPQAAGQIIRSAFGKSHFIKILGLRQLWYGPIVWGWWLSFGIVALVPDWTNRILFLFGLILAPLAGLSIRRKSLRLGLFSYVSWNVAAFQMLLGLFRKRVCPQRPLDSHEFKHR